ncbi:MAG: amidohydrolase family protein [Candidatus Neomarinimicrobiota bacterium]
MSAILLTNVSIINPFNDPQYIPDGYLLIENNTIDEIGTGSPDNETIKKKGCTELNFSGKTILPGMINFHTHLYSSLALGMPAPAVAPTNFREILKRVWWRLDYALDKNLSELSYQIGLIECLRNGVTTVIDHHSSQNFIEGALNLLADTATMLGVNIGLAFETTDRNGKERFERGLNENLTTIEKYQSNPNIWPLFGMHASFTISDESLAIIRDRQQENLKRGVHIHVSEDKWDEDDARQKGYRSVIQRLASFDIINDRSLIIHGLHLIPEDLVTLSEFNAVLIHNPSSNANNAVGILPSSTIQTLNPGLGTDGRQASMLREVNEGTLIRNASAESPINYLEFLFKNNPDYIEKLFHQKIGILKPGYRADLAIYDYQPKTEISSGNYLSHIQFGLGVPTDVMTSGQFRIRNNNFVDVDEDAILHEGQKTAPILWKKMSDKTYD